MVGGLLFLTLLMLVMVAYAAANTDVFLTKLNIRHILLATAPLAMVTMAQFNVLMVRGFDISVGSLMSLTVVLASFLIGAEAGPSEIVAGVALCLLAGIVVGGVNGALVRGVGINPVITTIATLSVLQGIALYLRPSPGGGINGDFMDLLAVQVGGIPLSFFVILAAAIGGDVWLYGTRSGLKLRAVGFREQAARRNGVHIEFVHMRAYLVSGLLAVGAGFFLSSEVGVGHPVIGQGYTLTSIAAAVLGGAALNGGRGSFAGALFGALFFTTTINVITLLGLNTGAGIITSGALTLFAVFLYSGWQPLARLLTRVRARFAPRPGAVATGGRACLERGQDCRRAASRGRQAAGPRRPDAFRRHLVCHSGVGQRVRDHRAAQPDALDIPGHRAAGGIPCHCRDRRNAGADVARDRPVDTGGDHAVQHVDPRRLAGA